MTRFFFPDPGELAKTEHSGLAGVPVLFDAEYRILEAENAYLWDRALSAWPIRKDGNVFRPKEDRLAPTTIIAMARRLHHFADWRHREHGNRLDDLTYNDVMTYERQQWLSQGAFEGRVISRRTAAIRADLATDFLLWAAYRELRGEFRLTVNHRASARWTVRPKAKASTGNSMKALTGLPGRAAIGAWLKAVERQRGVPKYLICRVMVETGMRLMEAVALEAGQWPSMRKVGEARVAGETEIDLMLTVTKNSTIRTVKVPIRLAATVAHWAEREGKGGRRQLQETCVARHGEDRRSKRLFLSDRPNSEGVPIQRHTVFDCFREVEPRPAGWHPHAARHAFACHFMLTELRTHAGDDRLDVERWIEHGGVVAVEKLKRLLGHGSLETTRIYLDYLRLNGGMAMLAADFHDRLDGSDR